MKRSRSTSSNAVPNSGTEEDAIVISDDESEAEDVEVAAATAAAAPQRSAFSVLMQSREKPSQQKRPSSAQGSAKRHKSDGPSLGASAVAAAFHAAEAASSAAATVSRPSTPKSATTSISDTDDDRTSTSSSSGIGPVSFSAFAVPASRSITPSISVDGDDVVEVNQHIITISDESSQESTQSSQSTGDQRPSILDVLKPRPASDFMAKKARSSNQTVYNEHFTLELVLTESSDPMKNTWNWAWTVEGATAADQLKSLQIGGNKDTQAKPQGPVQTKLSFEPAKKDRTTPVMMSGPVSITGRSPSPIVILDSGEQTPPVSPSIHRGPSQLPLDEESAEIYVQQQKRLLQTHTMRSFEEEQKLQRVPSSPSLAATSGFQTASGKVIHSSIVDSPSRFVPPIFGRAPSPVPPPSPSPRSYSVSEEELDPLLVSRQNALRSLTNAEKYPPFKDDTIQSKISSQATSSITLDANLPPDVPRVAQVSQDAYSWREESPSTGFALSLLKSQLQKNIRMCRPEAAVRFAKELLLHSFEDFIRRITIIIIEDAILHPAYPFLVWLMFANSKGFVPTDEHIDTCLQIVFEVASVVVRESLTQKLDDKIAQHQNIIDLSKLSPYDACLIKSIIGRASFGGMAGDVRMLKRFAILWYARCIEEDAELAHLQFPCPIFEHTQDRIKYIKGQQANPKKFEWLEYIEHLYSRAAHEGHRARITHKQVTSVQKDDIMLSAVDFHCSSVVDDLLNDGQIYAAVAGKVRPFELSLQGAAASAASSPTDSERETIRSYVNSAIWIHRSSLNCKLNTIRQAETIKTDRDLMIDEIFGIIKTKLDALSFAHVRSRMRPFPRDTNQHTPSSSRLQQL